MNSPKWQQELIWIRRNDQGVIVGFSEKLPENTDFIPLVPKPGVEPAKETEVNADVH